MSVDNVLDNEVDTIAFSWGAVYTKGVEIVPRKWWQFWKPGCRTILCVDARAWHYIKELEATSVAVIVICQTVEEYGMLMRLQDTVPEQFDYPPIALVPPDDLKWWCHRYRAQVVHGMTETNVLFLQNFIIKYGEPENV